MPAISSSAPGKVILFGEHAVVYGRPAIAVPVMQVRATATAIADIRGGTGQDPTSKRLTSAYLPTSPSCLQTNLWRWQPD